ncbi:MAG: hypothetical protein ACRDRA_12240 [Pseudonocardiaceae bacterium]
MTPPRTRLAVPQRLPPTPDSRSISQTCLPPEMEQLLIDVVADGFAVYCCGARAAPNALIACYPWEHHLDLVTIRNFDRITAARMPTRDNVDIFAPELVVWAYEGPPQQVLRALLNLMHPTHPDAPTSAVEPQGANARGLSPAEGPAR